MSTAEASPSLEPRTLIASDVLQRLHASALTDEREIRSLFHDLRDRGIWLGGRRTAKGDGETARVARVDDDKVLLETRFISAKPGDALYLNFTERARTKFFATEVVRRESDDIVSAYLPSIVYVSERRDRCRERAVEQPGAPRSVELVEEHVGWRARALVRDYSPVGLLVETTEASSTQPADLRVHFLDGNLAGVQRWASVRHSAPLADRPGWTRLGLSISNVPSSTPIAVDERSTITVQTRFQRAHSNIRLLYSGAAAASSRAARRLGMRRSRLPEIQIVDYQNDAGESLRGIVNSTGRGGTAVLIPPAWGRTKETLLPLAMTIVETFRKVGEPVTVLRFDGTRRRGESHKDRGFDRRGREHLSFLFNHAIDDIVASARFLAENDHIAAKQVVLVSFSAASIEARRAIQVDRASRIKGWVSVVGTPDLQSGMRAVSGGIDFVAGAEAGLKFGPQEVMGVATDIDALMRNALDLRLAFLEDARRDMAEITVPVTWIHGANDAWLDLSRVRLVMGAGATDKRRLLEVPTGHQLRSSREALEVFQLVAEQVAEMAMGQTVRGTTPSVAVLERMRTAERQRLPRVDSDVRGLWRDYLLGRDGSLGIELMNATDAYKSLMKAQIEGLQLRPGGRVADVGCGTGSFPLIAAELGALPTGVHVDELDFVAEALKRAEERLSSHGLNGLDLQFIECDLDDPDQVRRVASRQAYDAVLLSLVLSYLKEPARLLEALYSALKPGGRLVASTLKRDADISRLYLEGVDELRGGRAREMFGPVAERNVNESVRSFLNDMARVLDLEEEGVFRFLDATEVVGLVTAAGFRSPTVVECFGNPPQAVVITAEKPR
jgi:SAM-dependent methyltransferase